MKILLTAHFGYINLCNNDTDIIEACWLSDD